MPDVFDPAAAADHDMLRCHAQVEGCSEPAVVDHGRHPELPFADDFPDIGERIVEARVDAYHREVGAGGLVHLFEVRHLPQARDAPRRPELEVDRLLAVQRAEVDRFALDRADNEPGCRRADHGAARGLGALLTGWRLRRRGRDPKHRKAAGAERRDRSRVHIHLGSSGVTSGAPSGTIITAIARAGAVALAFSLMR
jgi:hypothetical protein